MKITLFLKTQKIEWREYDWRENMRIISDFHLTPKYLLKVTSMTSTCINSITRQTSGLYDIGQINISALGSLCN